MSTDLVSVEVGHVELGVIRGDSPAMLVAFATDAANELAKVIESRKLYSYIQGKKFVRCEGWTTLAAMLGVTPHEINTTEADGVYTSVVELRRIHDGQPVARASAECGAPDELDRHGKPMWASRARYARRSMAQTRATAKACRLAFSWVMVLAGFQPTPAEEIPDDEERGSTSTALPSKGSAAAPTSMEPAPTTPQRLKMSPPGVPEPPLEAPTRDTPYPGAGAVFGLTVRQWALNQLKAVDSGAVKVPDEWVYVVRLELKARAAKVASGTA